MGIFFILKYCCENQKELKSLNQINIGYAIFFIASGLNQFVYIIALVPNFWPAVDEFIGQTSITLFFGSNLPFPLLNQYMIIVILFILSIGPQMYPMDKYIKNRPKVPVFKISMIALILQIGIYLWLFIVNRALAAGGISGSNLLFEGDISSMLGQVWNILLIIYCIFQIFVLLLIMWNFVIYYLILAIKTPAGIVRTKSVLIFIGIVLLYLSLFVGNIFLINSGRIKNHI